MASLIQQESAPDIPLRPRSMDCPVPLSGLQSLLMKWISQRGFSHRMRAASIHIVGPLNISYLQRSLDAVVRRHESLRTRIVKIDNVYRQHIDSPREHNLELIDLTNMCAKDSWREATRIAQEVLDRRIDVSIDPLFEAKLIKLTDDEHVLISVIDHAVSDGVSCDILNREIWALYDQAEQGLSFSLPHLPVQFADYAVWQEQMHDAWQKQHEAYWKGHMAGAPDTRIPLEGSSEIDHPVGAMLHFALGKKLSEGLRNIALHEDVSLPVVVLVIYAAVMSRWCNQNDLVLTFVSHGRYRPELKNVIGWFASHLPMRLEIAAQDSFLDLLRRIIAERTAAHIHQDYAPYFLLECGTDVAFNWLPKNGTGTSANIPGEGNRLLRRQPFQASFVWPALFNPFFSDTAAGVGITVHYRPDRLAAGAIRKFGCDMRMLAEGFVNSPLRCVASIPVDMRR